MTRIHADQQPGANTALYLSIRDSLGSGGYIAFAERNHISPKHLFALIAIIYQRCPAIHTRPDGSAYFVGRNTAYRACRKLGYTFNARLNDWFKEA